VALAAPGSTVVPEHLSPDLTTEAPAHGPSSNSNGSGGAPYLKAGQSLADLVDEVERSLIAESMEKSGGNIAESARTLGLTRRGLYLKLKRLGIEGSGPQN
jgi:DNA-binding NtrC family response regulator